MGWPAGGHGERFQRFRVGNSRCSHAGLRPRRHRRASGTYGKGTVQRFLDLDNATGDDSVKPLGEMKLTIQKFYRITGKTTQLDGVTPDIVLPDFYNLVDLGERENDYPLESTTIDPVPYNQNAYHIADMSKLKSASACA